MKTLQMPALTRALAALGLTAASLAGQAQNLVVNGNFEQTTLTASGIITTTDLTGWTSNSPYNELYFPGTSDVFGAGNPAGEWLWGPNNVSANGLPATSPSGGNFVAVDADPLIAGISPTLTQQVSGLTAGHTYALSFYDAAAQYETALGPTTNHWQVTFGGQSQQAPTFSIPSQGFSGWIQATMQFTATAASQTLQFLAEGTPIGFPPVALLDGVNLTDVTPAPIVPPDVPPVTPPDVPPIVSSVPEPGNALFLAGGLVALAATLRRRLRLMPRATAACRASAPPTNRLRIRPAGTR